MKLVITKVNLTYTIYFIIDEKTKSLVVSRSVDNHIIGYDRIR